MKKKIGCIVGLIIMVIIIFYVFKMVNGKNIKEEKWNTFNIYNYSYSEGIIYLDLNGDNKEEKIELYDTGKYVKINNEEYIINLHYGKNNMGNWISCNNNSYYILDLNNDGILEIIHDTFYGAVSPRNTSLHNF